MGDFDWGTLGCLGVILLLVIIGGISFFVTAGLVWLACWAFGLAFSWKITFGIWIVMMLIRSCFKSTTTVKRD